MDRAHLGYAQTRQGRNAPSTRVFHEVVAAVVRKQGVVNNVVANGDVDFISVTVKFLLHRPRGGLIVGRILVDVAFQGLSQIVEPEVLKVGRVGHLTWQIM